MIIEADARRWVTELTEIEREMIILEIKDKAMSNTNQNKHTVYKSKLHST